MKRPLTEKQLAALRAGKRDFQPGNRLSVGHGRTRTPKLKELCLKALAEPSGWEAVIKGQIRAATKGSTPAAEFLAQRTEGKVPDKLLVVERREELEKLATTDVEGLIARLKALLLRLERGLGG